MAKPSKVKGENIEKEIDLINYSMFESRVKFLQGKVLTIVDASYQEKEQRNAVKNLVNGVFSQQLTEVYNWTHPNVQHLSEADMQEVDVEATLEGINLPPPAEEKR